SVLQLRNCKQARSGQQTTVFWSAVTCHRFGKALTGRRTPYQLEGLVSICFFKISAAPWRGILKLTTICLPLAVTFVLRNRISSSRPFLLIAPPASAQL